MRGERKIKLGFDPTRLQDVVNLSLPCVSYSENLKDPIKALVAGPAPIRLRKQKPEKDSVNKALPGSLANIRTLAPGTGPNL